MVRGIRKAGANSDEFATRLGALRAPRSVANSFGICSADSAPSAPRACPFCAAEDEVFGNDLAYAKFDSYPVSRGHMLIIPRRHAKDWFELDFDEQSAMILILSKAKEILDERYSPDGYNVGLNCGECAGQTVMHAHLHLIPRYKGDVTNPRGGVRAVIAAKKDYPF